MNNRPMVVAASLTKTYATAHGDLVEALGGVDLRIGSGHFVSVVGPSGCGKSTLLGILAGTLAPTAGTVAVHGTRALMPQRDLLMPWRTAAGNAAVALEAAGADRNQAERAARTQLSEFGLKGFEDAWPGELSGGMRQRVALARTMLAGADLLLLDEPFGALDALTRLELQAWLSAHSRERSQTTVLVTHDIEEAIALADTVHVLSPAPGQIVASIHVGLGAERDPSQRLSEEFGRCRAALLDALAVTQQEGAR